MNAMLKFMGMVYYFFINFDDLNTILLKKSWLCISFYVLQSKDYRSLGCWKDSLPRAITSLEGKSKYLEEHYRSRTDATKKCLKAALSFGFTVFAIQDGGQCFSSQNANETYSHYGSSSICRQDGKGGPMANHVYQAQYGNQLKTRYIFS